MGPSPKASERFGLSSAERTLSARCQGTQSGGSFCGMRFGKCERLGPETRVPRVGIFTSVGYGVPSVFSLMETANAASFGQD